MSDIFTAEKRSQIMSHIRSKNNKSTELKLIKIFKEYGITGWRRNYNVKGHPDFVFLKKKIAVFVDGCFWHGHKCQKHKPENNSEYWQKKIKYNKSHDRRINELFKNRDWTVIRIWECELKNQSNKTINKFRKISTKE
jgi:DNA mismatch endonuclease (patch repair protein)